MMRENRADWFRGILEMLRYGVFIGFSVLSIRMVLVTLNHSTSVVSVLVGVAVVAIAILAWWRIEWALYGFVTCIPVVSGFQVIGFMKGLPLLSVGFAGIYLMWFGKRVIWKQNGIVPGTGIGNLVDVLSAIVLISLIMELVPYPGDFIFHRLWSYPFVSQNESLYGIDGSYVLLQGLFFYRMLELSIRKERLRKRVVGVFFVQICIIVCFSMVQLVSKIPMPLNNRGILSSPFEDIHSYGSYVVLLFFLMAALSLGRGRKHKFAAVLGLFLFAFILLSSSFATLGATLIVGCIFGVTQFRFGKIVIALFVSLVFSAMLYINLSPSILEGLEGPVGKRYAERLQLDKAVGKLDGRFMSGDQAFGIIREFPTTGSGVGTFFRISRHYHFSETPHPNRIENAHNYYLQFCADLGVPALLIFLGIMFFTYKAGFKVLKKGLEESELVEGLLFGLSGYLITMLTGHPLLLSNQQFLFWFVIGVISVAQGAGRIAQRTDEKCWDEFPWGMDEKLSRKTAKNMLATPVK